MDAREGMDATRRKDADSTMNEDQQQNTCSQEQKSASQGASPTVSRRKKRLIAAVLVLCVFAAIAAGLWLFTQNDASSAFFDPNAKSGQAPYKTPEEQQAELDRIVEEGMFNISIASVIHFPDGSSAGTANIENVPGNRYNMKVSITLDDTGEEVYVSGGLAPGTYLEDIALARSLDPGTYAATALFTAIDTETLEDVGRAAAKITLVVGGGK